MPKKKTHSASKKRFNITGSGKVKRANAGKRHLLNGKPTKRLSRLGKTGYVSSANEKTVKQLLS